MEASRVLVVVADDFGIGPETSRGILELAAAGVVTGTVLMVNSPHAAAAVQTWRAAGATLELGWHPVLTQDRPVAAPERVSSLIGPDGCLWPLGQFLSRLYFYRICAAEIEEELRAQYRRFLDLVGRPPTLVNSHQHVALFAPVGDILLRVLNDVRPVPFVRLIREPWKTILRVPGARIKRVLLNSKGRRLAWKQERAGFPGADWLAGITDPVCVSDPEFFSRWLTRIAGQSVELMCHPGYHDPTLVGRDSNGDDDLQRRRVDELRLLRHPSFSEACRRAGFTLLAPSSPRLRGRLARREAVHAA